MHLKAENNIIYRANYIFTIELYIEFLINMKLFKLGNFYQYSTDWALFVFSQMFSIRMDAISRHIIPRIDDFRHSYQCCRSRFGK